MGGRTEGKAAEIGDPDPVRFQIHAVFPSLLSLLDPVRLPSGSPGLPSLEIRDGTGPTLLLALGAGTGTVALSTGGRRRGGSVKREAAKTAGAGRGKATFDNGCRIPSDVTKP